MLCSLQPDFSLPSSYQVLNENADTAEKNDNFWDKTGLQYHPFHEARISGRLLYLYLPATSPLGAMALLTFVKLWTGASIQKSHR